MTQPIEGVTGSAVRTPRVGRLDTLASVRRELRALYAEVRKGRLDSKTGSRLTYMLVQMANVLAMETFERRVEEMERRIANQS